MYAEDSFEVLPDRNVVRVELVRHVEQVSGADVSRVDDDEHVEEVFADVSQCAGELRSQHLSHTARPALVTPVLLKVVQPLKTQ